MHPAQARVPIFGFLKDAQETNEQFCESVQLHLGQAEELACVITNETKLIEIHVREGDAVHLLYVCIL